MPYYNRDPKRDPNFDSRGPEVQGLGDLGRGCEAALWYGMLELCKDNLGYHD